nr:hypothetical protein Iba_chr04fCG14250 [Ipomoea batatas]
MPKQIRLRPRSKRPAPAMGPGESGISEVEKTDAPNLNQRKTFGSQFGLLFILRRQALLQRGDVLTNHVLRRLGTTEEIVRHVGELRKQEKTQLNTLKGESNGRDLLDLLVRRLLLPAPSRRSGDLKVRYGCGSGRTCRFGRCHPFRWWDLNRKGRLAPSQGHLWTRLFRTGGLGTAKLRSRTIPAGNKQNQAVIRHLSQLGKSKQARMVANVVAVQRNKIPPGRSGGLRRRSLGVLGATDGLRKTDERGDREALGQGKSRKCGVPRSVRTGSLFIGYSGRRNAPRHDGAGIPRRSPRVATSPIGDDGEEGADDWVGSRIYVEFGGKGFLRVFVKLMMKMAINGNGRKVVKRIDGEIIDIFAILSLLLSAVQLSKQEKPLSISSSDRLVHALLSSSFPFPPLALGLFADWHVLVVYKVKLKGKALVI